ncbi:glycosyl hydrolase family 5 [Micromonospora sp. R77]|uniref:cellulose binding domain-containing protein n=1 Tax=Micromonospora sp. R77 TaxID=2925836 RepID=UPI001F61A559|nr:cellulose binding domain-containing protein [Micromonospora sp. R77]MCI4064522.1 glycosyl hydrolase family 5 [Micromonospora sp. R77]
MRARRVTLSTVATVLLSLAVVGVARADDGPALTTPGAPVVVSNEPHELVLYWTPSAWRDGGVQDPITYDLGSPTGPYTYRGLGSSDRPGVTLTGLGPGTTYRIAVQAYGNSGWSEHSPVATVRTAYGRAKVDYLNQDWSPTDNQARFVLRVTNTGTAPLDLTTVRVRYHVRLEDGSPSLVAECDWAALGCGSIRRTLQFFPVPAPPPGPNPGPTPTVYPIPGTPVPGWLELTFTTGTLAPGAGSGPIQLRLHKSNWVPIDERDDPSWRAATGAWTENDHVTLDVDGVREYGDQWS